MERKRKANRIDWQSQTPMINDQWSRISGHVGQAKSMSNCSGRIHVTDEMQPASPRFESDALTILHRRTPHSESQWIIRWLSLINMRMSLNTSNYHTIELCSPSLSRDSNEASFCVVTIVHCISQTQKNFKLFEQLVRI